MERPALPALEDPSRDRSVGKARDEAVVEGPVAIAHLLELLADPVGVHILGLVGWLNGVCKVSGRRSNLVMKVERCSKI